VYRIFPMAMLLETGGRVGAVHVVPCARLRVSVRPVVPQAPGAAPIKLPSWSVLATLRDALKSLRLAGVVPDLRPVSGASAAAAAPTAGPRPLAEYSLDWPHASSEDVTKVRAAWDGFTFVVAGVRDKLVTAVDDDAAHARAELAAPFKVSGDGTRGPPPTTRRAAATG
jgi:hypothetical protein